MNPPTPEPEPGPGPGPEPDTNSMVVSTTVASSVFSSWKSIYLSSSQEYGQPLDGFSVTGTNLPVTWDIPTDLTGTTYLFLVSSLDQSPRARWNDNVNSSFDRIGVFNIQGSTVYVFRTEYYNIFNVSTLQLM